MKKNLLSLIAVLLLCLPAIALGQTRGLFHETDCGSISNPNVDQVFCLQETTVAGRTAGHTYVWKGPVTGWSDVTGGASAGGDVVGPASATDGVPVLFDGTTGKLIKNSKVVLTQPATLATLTILNNKTFTVNKTLTLDGTDGTTMTFPSTSATIARTDAPNTFTGAQTITGGTVTVSTPLINGTQTWNDGAVTFIGQLTNITATASATLSTVREWQVGGVPIAGIVKDGSIFGSGIWTSAATSFNGSNYHGMYLAGGGFIDFYSGSSGNNATALRIAATGSGSANTNNLVIGSGSAWAAATTANAGGTVDTLLFRKAANVWGAGATQGTTDGTFQGKYNSSDGTAGATTTCTIVGLTSFTVKDGLITSCS